LVGSLTKHTRRSYIYSHQTYTEYPFQVNTYGLPPEVVRECLLGFIATLTKPSATAPEDRSFKAWILENLGEGMAKHFMVPFNEKLWQVSLDELTSDWVAWLVPKPELKDVVNGALGIKDKAFGYNPSFLYPTQGGIGVLPGSLLSGRIPDEFLACAGPPGLQLSLRGDLAPADHDRSAGRLAPTGSGGAGTGRHLSSR